MQPRGLRLAHIDNSNNQTCQDGKYTMSEKISSIDLQNFLKDFKNNSHTEVYEEGKLHPMDLKNTVIEYLEKIIKPIRENWKK